MDKADYAPGEEGEIRAEFNAGGKLGKTIKSIIITTDSTLQHKKVIRFKAFIDAELSAEISNIHIKSIELNKTESRKVHITNKMGKPFKIVDVNISSIGNYSSYFDIKVNKINEKNGKEFIQFDVIQKNEFNRENTISIPVSVYTDSEKVEKLRFFLIIHFSKPVEIKPTSLYMYNLKAGQKNVKRISINNNTGSDWDIENISCGKCPLTFEIKDMSDQAKAIWISVDKAAQPGMFNGRITVQYNLNGNKKTTDIPVRGVVK